jgi:hypothetical protein
VNTTAFTSIAIAALLIAMTPPSVAENSSIDDSPLHITACDVTENYVTVVGDLGVYTMLAGSTVRIAFVNRSRQTATNVSFLLKGRGGDQTILHSGRFSTGVRIDYTFGPFNYVDPTSTCEVTSVTFDDGTVWQRDRHFFLASRFYALAASTAPKADRDSSKDSGVSTIARTPVNSLLTTDTFVFTA